MTPILWVRFSGSFGSKGKLHWSKQPQTSRRQGLASQTFLGWKEGASVGEGAELPPFSCSFFTTKR